MTDLMTHLNKLKEIDYSDIPIGYKVIIMGLIEHAEAAEKRVAEYAAELADMHDAVKALRERKNAEVELARRDAAAGEPVGLLEHCAHASETVSNWPEWKKQGSDVTKFTAAQPAALPHERSLPEIYMATYHEAVGYNQAIADAKALGCQPPKVAVLPDASSDKFISVWQYRDSVVNSLDAAGINWEEDAAWGIADE